MSLTVIDGLPAHVLFVHAVVVLVPVTALLLVVCALRPAASRRLGPLLAVLGVITLVCVPLTTHAGEWLEAHVARDPLVHRHAELGDGLLPWVIGLCVLSLVLWWVSRRRASAGDDTAGTAASGWSKTPVRVVVAVLAVAVSVGSVVDVYRVGESGAKAAWHDGYSKTALHHGEEDGDEG